MMGNSEKRELLALKNAKDSFVKGNHKVLAEASGAYYDSESNTVESIYMGRRYLIHCADCDISPIGHSFHVSDMEQTLILHNLLTATGRKLSGRLVSFRDLPKGGENYYSAFEKRCIIPLLKTFGHEPERIYKALSVIPGEKSTYGDASVCIQVLPCFPVTYVIWGTDEEFPASASVLFDAFSTDYLPVEDIAISASFGAYAILKNT